MDALLVIDVQNDFLPGGSLAVPEGNRILPTVRRLCRRFPLVIATQDWHPNGHFSFASQHPDHSVGETVPTAAGDQILWPDHCVQESFGAKFSDAIEEETISHVVRKGTDPGVDSYSGFFDNNRERETDLNRLLVSLGIERLFVVGLATDYCVRFTVLDAIELGYTVFVVEDGVRGVGLNAHDIEAAHAEMSTAGATLIRGTDVASHMRPLELDSRERRTRSKFLSLLLRHRAADFNLDVDEQGWASVADLLRILNEQNRPTTRGQLTEVVALNDKMRFAFDGSGERIRALQGHSIPIELDYPAVTPPKILLHGTPSSAVASIRKTGLQSRGRHHVHLHADRSVADQVGRRRGNAVVLTIHAAAMHADGHRFYRTPNSVWLTDFVPPEYID